MTGSSRQWFFLAPMDHDQRTEVDRLVSLRATRLGVGADGAAVLADPDGNNFLMLPRRRSELGTWWPS